jgi:hypothetical protein
MEHKVYRLINSKIKQKTEQPQAILSIELLIEETRKQIAQNRTFSERILSYKALHGALMFTSFINVAGRTVAFNGTGDFTCHTYPYYKQIDTPRFNGLGQALTAVPLHDPNYDKLPWASGAHWWAIELSVVPMILAFSIGSCCAWKNSSDAKKQIKIPGNVASVRLDPENLKTSRER